MPVSSDRMYLQLEDGTQLALRAVDGVIQQSTNGSEWIDLTGSTTGDTWYDLEAAFHAALGYGLTESISIPVGVSNDGAILGAGAVDAGVEGGGLRGDSDTVWTTLHKATVVQNVKTSRFALSIQASFSPIASAKASYAGLVNAGRTHEIVVGTNTSVNATKFMAFAFDGSAIEPTGGLDMGTADAAVYTWRIYSNATTMTIDRAAKGGGTAALSTGTILTSATHMPSDAMLAAFFNSASTTGQAIYKALISYVGP